MLEMIFNQFSNLLEKNKYKKPSTFETRRNFTHSPDEYYIAPDGSLRHKQKKFKTKKARRTYQRKLRGFKNG